MGLFSRIRFFFKERGGFSLSSGPFAVICVLAAMLPLCAIGVYWYSCFCELSMECERVAALERRACVVESSREQSYAYFSEFSRINPYYVEEKLEKMPLLQEEAKKLAALVQATVFSGNAALQRRYGFVSGAENQLRFKEVPFFESKKWKESKLIQLSPVEIDENDLNELLRRVEEPHRGKPDITVLGCLLRLEKGKMFFSMELLKREPLSDER